MPPRVFISYAWKDGTDFARKLRESLERESIPLWQDRVMLEGGRDWWLQITESLDQIEFMVLVMTPAAMQSETVRKEWRYARQQGVCVYPVKAAANLDFASLPRWMRDVHFYDLGLDLDHFEQGAEWSKFLHHLSTRCEIRRVPFMGDDLPADFVPRPTEFEALIGQTAECQPRRTGCHHGSAQGSRWLWQDDARPRAFAMMSASRTPLTTVSCG